jgi:hypothetical protein
VGVRHPPDAARGADRTAAGGRRGASAAPGCPLAPRLHHGSILPGACDRIGIDGEESATVTSVTAPPARRSASDAVLTGAVETAREAAVEIAAQPAHVGEHLGAVVEGERLVTHRFACADLGYRGWQWAVTLARPPRGRTVTVCEAVLLPGDEALLAKEWVPWSERLAPGDLGVGDLLPTEPDDDRLEPGYTAVPGADDEPSDDDTDRVAVWELGLGRVRVLSPIGRDDAVDRWYSGAHGPTAAIAEAAPAPCSTCGFVVPLGGSLRRVFGVCANAFSPSDGQVVSYDHGCGAHSEVQQLPPPVEVSEPVVDEQGFDLISLSADDDDSAAGS